MPMSSAMAPGPVENDNDRRELFLSVIWSFHGTLYRWGGDDPSGLDCSGVMVEGLHATGAISDRTDLSSAAIYDFFEQYHVSHATRGAMVFWQRPGGSICHVEACLDSHYSIGARGGGGKIKTAEDALEANAFVRIAPIYGRAWKLELAGFINLFTHPDIEFRYGPVGG